MLLPTKNKITLAIKVQANKKCQNLVNAIYFRYKKKLDKIVYKVYLAIQFVCLSRSLII